MPFTCYQPELEEPRRNEHYEEKLNVMGIQWNVSAVFCGSDSDDVEERKQQAERIINRFDNEIDAYIVQKRSELSAELVLICDELDID